MVVNRTSKMLAYINYRMRITIVDGRQIVGRFMAFDRHMNLVLSDAEEFRKLPPKKGLTEEDRAVRRVLGFILLRGEEVVSMTVEGPPPQEDKRARAQAAPAGPGSGRAAGRGMPGMVGAPAPGLMGPIAGMGGPSAASMRPQFSAPPAGFRPGMPPPGMPPARLQARHAAPGHAAPGLQAGHAPARYAAPGVQAPGTAPAPVRRLKRRMKKQRRGRGRVGCGDRLVVYSAAHTFRTRTAHARGGGVSLSKANYKNTSHHRSKTERV